MASKRPNVLWIQTDEQRPDSIGAYGEPWAKTPNLDRLAAEGTVFHECHVQSPMCVPSRTSMLLGKYPQETEVYSNATQGQEGILDPELKAFPNLFADEGYKTASLGKWHTPAHPTWQEKVQFYAFLGVADAALVYEPFTDESQKIIKNPGSFMDTVDIPVILGGVYPQHDWGTNPGSHLTDMSIDWLRHAADAGDSFLLRVSYAWPHTPVLPPVPWDTLFDPDEVKCNALQQKAHDERSSYDQWLARVEGGMRMTKDQWKQAAAYYYGLCSYIDHEVGRLVRALESFGLLDNTIVAYNTDHGRSMGEFGHIAKGTYDHEVWRVPFIFWAPGLVPAGEHRHDLCELMDFGSTLCSLAGIDLAPGMRGRDLFDPTQPEPDAVFAALDMFAHRRIAIRTRQYRYDCSYLYDENYKMKTERTTGLDRRANLTDLENDPLELVNLIHDPAYADVAEGLYTRLDEWMTKAE